MTQDNLFQPPDSPSPRLKWMRRHGVKVFFSDVLGEYVAYAEMKVGFGDTELEALTDFAIKNNLKLWNEE